MKQKIFLLLGLLLLSLSSAATDPQTVLKAIVDNQRGGSVRATLTLSVIRPGRETQYVLEVVSDGNERSLSRVKSPAREAGQAFLRVGDNLLIYSPALKRVLRLPPSGQSDSFLGSDLSYSDLSGRDLEQDYTARIAAEESFRRDSGVDESSVTLELTPKPQAPTPYGKVTVKARAKTFEPLEVTFFDQRGQAVKKVTFAQYVEVGGRRFPVQTTVEDLLRPGNRTSVVYSDYKFGVSLPESCFSQRALEVGC